MEKSLKTLQTVKVKYFYTCAIWQNEINLQGKATEETIKYCKTLGVDTFINEGGMLKAEIGTIKIVLTF